jgi:hypothetical protein
MKENEVLTIAQIADMWDMLPSTVRRFIKNGRIQATKSGDGWIIENYTDVFHKYWIGIADRKIFPPTTKNLKPYALYHDSLDVVSYLINFAYLTGEELRNKLIRNDLILQNYLAKISNTSSFIKKEGVLKNRKEAVKSLKQAWYYELYFNSPEREFPLDCSSKGIHSDWSILQNRMSFMAPKIIMGYYAIYYYIRTLTLMFYEGKLNTQHQTTLNVFSSCIMGKLSNKILLYPFNIICKKGQHTLKTNKTLYPPENYPKHYMNLYARWRRGDKDNTIEDAEKILLSSLHKIGRKDKTYKTKNIAYNIFDILQEFRVWANYIDIDVLMSVRGEGYRAYLDVSLSKIMFVLGGLCEYVFIKLFGERQYNENLEDYHDSFIETNPILYKRGLNNPILQRNIILQDSGALKSINNNLIRRDFSHIFPMLSKGNNTYRYAIEGETITDGEVKELLFKKKQKYKPYFQ